MATNTRSISQSLLASEESQEHTYLYEPVLPNTHGSVDRLAKYLGLSTANEKYSAPDLDIFCA